MYVCINIIITHTHTYIHTHACTYTLTHKIYRQVIIGQSSSYKLLNINVS